MSHVDDARSRAQETRDFFERPHRRRKPDALRTASTGSRNQIV
jgi:hypothetical protein